MDFEEFIEKSELNENDFMFLDPPYDTDFSDYEGKDFSRMDQERLANTFPNPKSLVALFTATNIPIFLLFSYYFYNSIFFEFFQ
jgi:DNA adenine methylase